MTTLRIKFIASKWWQSPAEGTSVLHARLNLVPFCVETVVIFYLLQAFQSRQKFLNTYGIKPSQSEETVAESLKEETVTTASIAGTTPTSGTDTSGSSEVESSSQTFLPGPQVPPSFFNEPETSLTLEPPPHLLPKPLVPPMDFTPYLR